MKRVFTPTALLIATMSFAQCSTNREKAASSGNNHPSATPSTSNVVASSPTPSAVAAATTSPSSTATVGASEEIIPADGQWRGKGIGSITEIRFTVQNNGKMITNVKAIIGSDSSKGASLSVTAIAGKFKIENGEFTADDGGSTIYGKFDSQKNATGDASVLTITTRIEKDRFTGLETPTTDTISVSEAWSAQLATRTKATTKQK